VPQVKAGAVSETWFGLAKFAVATGIGYFLLGRLGMYVLALDGVQCHLELPADWLSNHVEGVPGEGTRGTAASVGGLY